MTMEEIQGGQLSELQGGGASSWLLEPRFSPLKVNWNLLLLWSQSRTSTATTWPFTQHTDHCASQKTVSGMIYIHIVQPTFMLGEALKRVQLFVIENKARHQGDTRLWVICSGQLGSQLCRPGSRYSRDSWWHVICWRKTGILGDTTECCLATLDYSSSAAN